MPVPGEPAQRCAYCGLSINVSRDAYGRVTTRGFRKHEERCARATPQERAHYKIHRNWNMRPKAAGRVPGET